MAITVRFIGAFRSLLGRSRLRMSFEESISLSEALKKMAEKLPELERIIFDAELKDPRPNTLILVNGKEISILNGLETMLKNGDEVVLIPVVHGG